MSPLYSLLFNWGKTAGTSSPPVLSFLLMHSGLTGWHSGLCRDLSVTTMPSRWASWKTLPMVIPSRLSHLELSPVNACVTSSTASRSHFFLLTFNHTSTMDLFYWGKSDNSQLKLDFTNQYFSRCTFKMKTVFIFFIWSFLAIIIGSKEQLH